MTAARSISERAREARTTIGSMPEPERLWSERYRLVAKEWVRLDGAARMLEENKSIRFSELMLEQGEMPVSRAEVRVKASKEWKDYVEAMVEARTAANLAHKEMKWCEMKYGEAQSIEATARHEARLSR